MRVFKIIIFAFSLFILLPLTGCQHNSISTVIETTTTTTKTDDIVKDSNKLFELKLYSDKSTYNTTDKIKIWATLKYIGDNSYIEIWHGDPYISFYISDGKDFNIGSMINDVLGSTELEKDKLYTFEYSKNGAYDADDPKADFWKKFYAEKDLYLLEGKYTIKVSTAFSLTKDIAKSNFGLSKELKIVVKPGPNNSMDNQSSNVDKSAPQGSLDTISSYWDTFAKTYGGSKAIFSQLPRDVDLLPLYIAGMQHEDIYVRWVCASKAFDYHNDDRKPEIIKALKPLLTDPSEQVRNAAKFSMEVLAETFSGPEFIYSPDKKHVAFNPFMNIRFNDGKLWIYSADNRQISMPLQLLSVGGDSGVAGYIHWSPDGSKFAVGDGGRLWSNTVIFNLDTYKTNNQDLYSYLTENSKKFGYHIGDYQRPDPSVRFLEWSPDSKKVLLLYYFAEDMEKWQSGLAVYNCETDKYERIIPNKSSENEHPLVDKPNDFHW